MYGPSDAEIGQFAAFQIDLDRAIDAKARSEIGPAAEACVSGTRILSHIHLRYARLVAAGDGDPSLGDFLQSHFRPALAQSEERARRVYAELGLDFEVDSPAIAQTLIASDFGTHNALRSPDGRISFLDFEYFGWDDPLTSIGNFVLHPSMELTAHQRGLYQDKVLAHFGASQARRLSALLPLYALRWCAIILSDLLPERLAHRNAAGSQMGDRNEVRVRQFAKATRLLVLFSNN